MGPVPTMKRGPGEDMIVFLVDLNNVCVCEDRELGELDLKVVEIGILCRTLMWRFCLRGGILPYTYILSKTVGPTTGRPWMH